MGKHRHLGSGTGLTGNGLDLHDTLTHLGNLFLEETLHQLRMGSGNHHARASLGIPHFNHINLDAVIGLQGLAAHLLVLGKVAIHLAEIHDNGLSGIPLYGTGHNLLLHGVVLVVQQLPLFLTNLLHDDALRILGGDTTEALGVDGHLHNLSQLILGIQHLRLNERNLCDGVGHLLHHGLVCDHSIVAGIRVHVHTHIVCRAEVVLAGCLQRYFNRLNQGLL